MIASTVTKIPFGTIETYFPFAFIVDADLRIVSVGKSLAKISAEFVPDAQLEQLTRLLRPPIAFEANSFREWSNEVVEFLVSTPEVRLRGQIVPVSDQLLFLGSPLFDNSSQLSELGLDLSDFALHDLTLDNLFLRQHQQLQLEDHRRMVKRLREVLAERDRLFLHEQQLTEDLSAAGDLFILFDPDGLILEARCARKELLPRPANQLIGSRAAECFPGMHSYFREREFEICEKRETVSYELHIGDEAVFESRLAQTHDGHILLLGNDVTAQRRMQETLEYRSLHDALTGLANRDLLSREIEVAQKSGSAIGLIFVDLDDFKAMNDTYGHPSGDKLLCHVAAQLKLSARDSDLPVRLGGDEFAILARNLTDPQAAHAIAKRLLDAVRKPVVIAGQSHEVTASVGVALSAGESDGETLLCNADIAMYTAKGRGKNSIAIFDDAMLDAFREQSTRGSDIRSAIRNCEIGPYYRGPCVSRNVSDWTWWPKASSRPRKQNVFGSWDAVSGRVSSIPKPCTCPVCWNSSTAN